MTFDALDLFLRARGEYDPLTLCDEMLMSF